MVVEVTPLSFVEGGREAEARSWAAGWMKMAGQSFGGRVLAGEFWREKISLSKAS